MSYQSIKPFLTYQQQLLKLSNDKTLLITDTMKEEKTLEKICYYALIDGYKDLFYNPMTRKYKAGTRLEDILSLYYFDESLRGLYFKYLCHIEQRMRSLISYHFSETYSHLQEDYLNPKNYNYIPKLRKNIDYLIHKVLSFEANKNIKHSYVVYQSSDEYINLWPDFQNVYLP